MITTIRIIITRTATRIITEIKRIITRITITRIITTRNQITRRIKLKKRILKSVEMR